MGVDAIALGGLEDLMGGRKRGGMCEWSGMLVGVAILNMHHPNPETSKISDIRFLRSRTVLFRVEACAPINACCLVTPTRIIR